MKEAPMTETFDERVLQRWLEITRVYLEQRGASMAKPYAEAAIIVRPKSQNASTKSLAPAP
jgi:hypothetical protein